MNIENEPAKTGITGRPAKGTVAGERREMYFDTPMHKFLCERLPIYVEGGRISVKRLAAAMDYSAYRVYCIIKTGKMSTRAAKLIMTISQDAVSRDQAPEITREDIIPFLLPDLAISI